MSLICDRCKASQFGEKRQNVIIGSVELTGGVVALLCNRCHSEWNRRLSDLPAYLDMVTAIGAVANCRAALHAGPNPALHEGCQDMLREQVKAEQRLWNAAAAFVRGEPVGQLSPS